MFLPGSGTVRRAKRNLLFGSRGDAMPFVPNPGVVQVNIRGTKDTQLVENVLHFGVFHTPVAEDLTLICNGVRDAVISDWLPALPSDVTMREVYAKSLELPNDVQFTSIFPAGSVGTMAGVPLPNNVSICVSLRSGATGRSARGRLFWLGLSQDQVVENQITTAASNDILVAVNAVYNVALLNSYRWIITSYVTNKAPRPGGPVQFIVNGILFTNLVIDSQRRRLPGRGT